MKVDQAAKVTAPISHTSQEWHGFSFPRALGIALLGGSLLASGCSKAPVEPLQPTPITEVLKQPNRYLGQRIAVEGVTTLRRDVSELCSINNHTDILMRAEYRIFGADETSAVLKDNRLLCFRKYGHLDATKPLSTRFLLKDGESHKIEVTLQKDKGTTNYYFRIEN